MPDGGHVPVLLDEAVAALAIKPDGALRRRDFRPRRAQPAHSRRARSARACLSRSTAIPRPKPQRADLDATRAFAFHRAWFSELPAVLDARGIAIASTACCSTSASLHRRSTIRRADSRCARTDRSTCAWTRRADSSAAEWLATSPERELRGVIADYGEERFAQQIARAIVAARAHEPVVRTRQLAAIVAKAVGSRGRGDWSQDPATRTFQAVRIFINQELQELPLALERILPRLRDRRPACGHQLSTRSRIGW